MKFLFVVVTCFLIGCIIGIMRIRENKEQEREWLAEEEERERQNSVVDVDISEKPNVPNVEDPIQIWKMPSSSTYIWLIEVKWEPELHAYIRMSTDEDNISEKYKRKCSLKDGQWMFTLNGKQFKLKEDLVGNQ